MNKKIETSNEGQGTKKTSTLDPRPSPLLKAKIHITLKTGVLDPQGKAIAGALHHLGFNGVGEVRQGKFIEIELKETDRKKAHDSVETMCRKLLANTVIENYRFEVE